MSQRIRKAQKADLVRIAEIYAACFPREESHFEWIDAIYHSYPKGVYYVLEVNNEVIGYILWCFKNGFRKKSIIELEQVGVHPDFSGKGFGRVLIKDSFDEFKALVKEQGFVVGALLVTTSEGNYAESLYKSILGVETASKIQGYGSGNELILYKSFT